jgi:hypothetical protein
MSIYRKLQVFQDAAPTVHKNCTAHINGRQYRYADLSSTLESLKPALKLVKLVLIQTLDGQTLVTKLIDSESSEIIESRFPMEFNGLNWHGIGSALSYARRYSILSILGLAPDDDDDAVSTIPERPVQAINGHCNGHGEAVPECPDCGQAGMKSKYNGGFYCGRCRKPYVVEIAR